MKSRAFARTLATMCLAALLGAGSAPDSAVADAAQRGDVETVRSLLQSGADVNASQGDGMTALHWAAQGGNAALAEMLVYAGGNVNAGTRIGTYTPLHIASRLGSIGVAEILIDAGADVSAAASNSGARPIHLAAGAGSDAIIKALLEHGADIEARETSWGQTPLTFAAAGNRTDAIRVLLDAGADPNASARFVDTAEMAEADQAAERRLTEVLADFKEREGGGADWQPTPSQVQAAIELAREIARKWPDVPSEDSADDEEEADEEEVVTEEAPSDEDDPSEEAAVEEHEEESPDEVEGEEEPETPDEDEQDRPMSYPQQVEGWGGLTPLLHAVRQGHAEAALMLLEGGADIDQPSLGDQTTPLLMATLNGQWDLAMILVERGADTNVASVAGATPLYTVLEREWEPRASYAHPTEHQRQQTTHLQMMRALLEAGADPNVRLSRHLWYMEYTFGVLRGSGINLKGATPFWRAAYALDVEAMRLLTEYGAESDIPTMKPPARRRPPDDPPPDEEEEEGKAEQQELADQLPDSVEGLQEDEAELQEDEAEHDEDDEEHAEDDEDDEDDDEHAEEGDEEDELDPSGLPPIPVNGPAIFPIHAAAGVGYGQSFAGNAHRYVPDGWMDALRYLVEEHGADVNQRDANGYTAIHHAASRGDNEMILYLVEHGADVMAVSREGETTVDMANGPVQRVQPFPETIALLEELGAVNNNKCVSCEQ